MAEYTKNYNLEKQQGNDNISIEGLNENFDKIDTALGNSAKFEKASGTGTGITLKGIVLEDGASKIFIVSISNNGAATTINGKKLYKSGTTTSPSLIAGKAVTVWYSQTNDCFYSDAYADEIHTHAVSDITNFPTSLPANGGNAATVNGKTVAENVPAGAKFTDTVYIHPDKHAPSILSNGALPIGVTAAGSSADYGTARLRNIYAGTADLTAGASALPSGYLYIVYE
ncbi:hypothetical protein [Anaerocolumna sp.]|uniref:hypothetical protein n=1 Tax=Anaerocolumna sp. TaxID=2041569 RepID=UPI0028ABEB7E|nr:hypothetical protein [Anaerocolumna sp.]